MSKLTSVPMAMGVMMIIFATMGLLVVLGTTTSTRPAFGMSVGDLEALSFLTTANKWGGLVVFGFHLTAGIKAVGYRRDAPNMAKTYALIALTMVLFNILATTLWVDSSAWAATGYGFAYSGLNYILAGVCVFWPVAVWVVMGRPFVKQACSR